MSTPTSTSPHLLLLGGTGEARLLAEELASAFPGWRVTTSLAGRVESPEPVTGQVRVGGFGGAEGLAAWLAENEVTAVVDATHPFAQQITVNAFEAVNDPRLPRPVPLLRLQRPQWEPAPGDTWHEVGSVAEAAQLADSLGERLLVTTGRQEASAFADVAAWCLMRSVEAPSGPLPARHELLLSKGPFTAAGELELMRRHDIDVLVAKNSGGPATSPKLEAAREAGVTVVMVRRPALPEQIDVAESIPEALLWLASVNAESGRTNPEDEPEAVKADGRAQAAFDLLQRRGWAVSGQVAEVTSALDAGEPVDLDNPAGWVLPLLGDSLSAEHERVTARVVVTDMDPAMAVQFSTGAPQVVLSPPSLVVGLDLDSQVAPVDVVVQVRELLKENLLAIESLTAVAGLDGTPGGEASRVVAEALETGHVLNVAPSENAERDAAMTAVTAAGVAVVVPTRSAEHTSGSARVAVGRLTPGQELPTPARP